MKQNKKIDIYLRQFRDKRFYYECSTNWDKTCKEVKEKYCKRHGLDSSQVKTCFAKK